MAKIKVDFTGVEAHVRCEEGQHVAKIISVEEKTATTGSDMLEVKYQVVKGESTGATIYDNIVLSEKALWKFKSLLEILGMKADGKVAINTDNLIGKTLIIEVRHEEYNGSMKAKISEFKKLAASKAIDEDDDEDYEDEDEDDTPAETPKERKAREKKEAEAKALADAKKKKSAKKPEPEPEEDDDEDEDDEEDDEPVETPKQKKARLAKEAEAKAKKAKQKAKAPVEEEDEDDEWDEEE